MAVNEKALLPLGPWPGGTDNLNRETALTRSDDGKSLIAFREGVNIDLPRGGWPVRRKGFGLALDGDRTHSLWHGGRFPYMLLADGDTQYAWRPGRARFVVKAGLAVAEISYCIPTDRVYCSNGRQAWAVTPHGEAMEWGVESPAGQPALTVSSSGGLAPGKRMVAITYVDLFGEESGTGLASLIDLPNGGGVQLVGIPQPISANVARVRVYISPANGDLLYFARDLPVGQTSALIGDSVEGKPLETQHLTPMLPATIVRALAGRIYTAQGNEQRWSESQRYGLTNRDKNVRRIGSHINLMEPVGDGGESPGFFVADPKGTYWVGGADPATQTLKAIYPYGAIPGTGCVVPASMFGLDTTLPVAYWLAANGVAQLGLPGGTVVPLREKQVVAPNAEGGASLFMERDGIRKIITTLRGSSRQNMGVGDHVSSTVERNGIVL